MIEETLYSYMMQMAGRTPDKYIRYIDNDIDWSSRLIGIIGPRGVGKSTLLLQKIKKAERIGSLTFPYLYVSADNLYFSNHTIVSLADSFAKDGGKWLYIDEIHKYKGWSRELKQIYDTHPDLNVVFTGSSILDIRKGEADLSRRALMYSMQGLSFREYLMIFHDIEVPIYSLEDVIRGKVKLPVDHPLPYFRDYLAQGYYPFSKEGNFIKRMQTVVSQTIEVDISQYADMNAATARKLKRLLAIISELVPFKPNMENLAKEVGVSKNNISDYFTYLERAGMVAALRTNVSGLRELGKVEKIYIDNTSLMTALALDKPNVGNMRETFFFNQLRVRHNVTSSRETDFCIGDYSFEVGGKKKGQKQIENVKNGIIVKDDIEFGQGIITPLWAYGFTY